MFNGQLIIVWPTSVAVVYQVLTLYVESGKASFLLPNCKLATKEKEAENVKKMCK